MCGIAGLLGANFAEADRHVGRMIDALRHRGPDAAGQWDDAGAGIALGHRRLAIIDLSAAGRQPMVSADGRWVLAYNGEIYNHRDLRAALDTTGQAPAWRGHSDTESLLAAFSAWGCEATLTRAHGMFALALWDRERRELILARDRFGEKPLYYGRVGGAFAFASETKALRRLPGFAEAIDPVSLRAMLGRGYVPAERSIYAALAQVPPGCWLTVSRDGEPSPPRRYYDYAAVVAAGAADPIASEDEALARLRDTLGGAVERQFAADVPVGTLLSGGIDSSLITALAARRSPGPVRTFSIGFVEAGFDEAPHARAVAAHLGTEHHELYLGAADARAIIPALPTIWDEPFGDSSQIPTFLVSRFAREHVTVALSGDAGDELFGGYQRHRALPALERRLRAIPQPLRRAGLRAGSAIPPEVWTALASWRAGTRRPAFFGHKVRRALAAAGGRADLAGLYHSFLDDWHGQPSPVQGANTLAPADFAAGTALDAVTRVMLADARSYLPGDILTKVDRAAMAVSLEGRIPFLDPEVAALAARIPTRMKMAGGQGKAILRRLLGELVPPVLVDRPKAGFAMPLGAWLAGPLRDWAEHLLAAPALADGGLLEPAPIRARWAAHLAGREDASQALWSVLMLQAWRAEAVAAASPRPRGQEARAAVA
ncbi:MAG: asparagine synthase (glutamine-hydrolyzing) [Novosphingobium sp.]